MNKVFLKGNLGKDPKIITAQNKRIAFLRVATTESWLKDGEKQSFTDWHDVIVLKDQAVEYAAEYLKEGDGVLIEGKMKYRLEKLADGRQLPLARVMISSGDDTLRGFFSRHSETEGQEEQKQEQGEDLKNDGKTILN